MVNLDTAAGLTGAYGGMIQLGPMRVTCLLDEGAVTPRSQFTGTGLKRKGAYFASEILPGDLVELFDDVALTHALLKDGMFVMRKLQTAGLVYLAKVIEIHDYMRVPAEAVTDLDDRIAQKLLRFATVEPVGMTGFFEAPAIIQLDGGGAKSIDVADPVTLALDIHEAAFTYQAGGHGLLISLNHLEGAVGEDVTGNIRIAVGWAPMEVIAGA
jgi:hypothetical protein